MRTTEVLRGLVVLPTFLTTTTGFVSVAPSRNAITSTTQKINNQCYNPRHCTTLPPLHQAADLDVDIANLSNDTSLETPQEVVNGKSSVPPPLPVDMLKLPRHSDEGINKILVETEDLLQKMHEHSKAVDTKAVKRSMTPTSNAHDAIYSNTYVDLGKVDTVGFDYDYTLVHYTDELLELLYDMALTRLVNDRFYPAEMLTSGLKYDPFFSIRGKFVESGMGRYVVSNNRPRLTALPLVQALRWTRKLDG